MKRARRLGAWLADDRAGPYAVLFAGVFSTLLALAQPDSVIRSLQIAFGVVLVACGGFVIGCVRTRRSFVSVFDNAMQRAPKSITLHRDDEGGTHALVSFVGGDVRTFAIPDDEAETPSDAVRYVIGLLVAELESEDDA